MAAGIGTDAIPIDDCNAIGHALQRHAFAVIGPLDADSSLSILLRHALASCTDFFSTGNETTRRRSKPNDVACLRYRFVGGASDDDAGCKLHVLDSGYTRAKRRARFHTVLGSITPRQPALFAWPAGADADSDLAASFGAL